MSCGCNNNSNGSPFGYSPYGSACAPELPYPQVSAESVPSLINNLTTALYGLISKSVVNGKVVWTTPCDGQFPNFTGTVFGISRNAGEGLLCYFLRAFSQTTTTAIIPNGTIGQLLVNNGGQLLSWLPSGPVNYVLTSRGNGSYPQWLPAQGGSGPTTPVTAPKYVYVSDYGAIGDGVTDDTVAIQNAINYAVTLGNAVVFFDSKTYALNTPFTLVNTGISSYLRFSGGNSTTKLSFVGNDSVLYTNVTPTNGAALFQLYSQFKSLRFTGIRFERGNSPASGSESSLGFYHIAYVGATSELLEFENCTFTNCHSAFRLSEPEGTQGWSSVFKSVKKLNFQNCEFLFPYGDNYPRTSNVGLGGGVAVYLGSTYDQARFDSCYFNGMQGGVVPQNCQPLDGFLNVIAPNTVITNCEFKNNLYETILASQFNRSSVRLNSFVQPEIGSNVTVSVNYIPDASSLVVGQLYTFNVNAYNTFDTLGTSGVYKYVSGPSTIIIGSSLVFQRMSDSYLGAGVNLLLSPLGTKQTNSLVPAGSTIPFVGFGIQAVPLNYALNQNTLIVTSCNFDSESLKDYLGNNFIFQNLPYASATYEARPSPCIFTNVASTITGNYFSNFNLAIRNTVAGSVVVTKPVTITGNYFNVIRTFPTLSMQGQSILTETFNSIISNNVFRQQDSLCGSSFINVAYGQKNISNNTFSVDNILSPYNYGNPWVANSQIAANAYFYFGSYVYYVTTGGTFASASSVNFTGTTGRTFTGNTTASGTSLTNVSSTTGLVAGQYINGTGITSGTTISSIYGNTITLSQAATITQTGASFYASENNGSTVTITNVSSVSGLNVGQYVSGTGVSSGAFIALINGNVITLSQPISTFGTGVSFSSTGLTNYSGTQSNGSVSYIYVGSNLYQPTCVITYQNGYNDSNGRAIPWDNLIKDNRVLNVDYFTNSTWSSIIENYLGSPNLGFSNSYSHRVKNRIASFDATKTGWVRINAAQNPNVYDGCIDAEIELAGLKFEVSTGSYNFAFINVIRNRNTNPISFDRIRVISSDGRYLVDIHVNDLNFLSSIPQRQISSYSEDGLFILNDSVQSSVITSMATSGSNTAMTCVGHGLTTGQYIFISDSLAQTSTSINNNSYQVTVVDQNTFTIPSVTVINNGTAEFFTQTNSASLSGFVEIGGSQGLSLTGSGASATFTISSGGVVNNYTLVNGGSGYTNAPALIFSSPIYSFTGNTTSASNSITSVTPTANLVSGQTITGSGIPTGTIITNVTGSTVSISQNATATATGVSLQSRPVAPSVSSTVVSGSVTGFTINYGGAGFATAPTATILDGIAVPNIYPSISNFGQGTSIYGSPQNKIYPAFIGQICYNTKDNLFYIGTGSGSNYSWHLMTTTQQ